MKSTKTTTTATPPASREAVPNERPSFGAKAAKEIRILLGDYKDARRKYDETCRALAELNDNLRKKIRSETLWVLDGNQPLEKWVNECRKLGYRHLVDALWDERTALVKKGEVENASVNAAEQKLREAIQKAKTQRVEELRVVHGETIEAIVQRILPLCDDESDARKTALQFGRSIDLENRLVNLSGNATPELVNNFITELETPIHAVQAA